MRQVVVPEASLEKLEPMRFSLSNAVLLKIGIFINPRRACGARVTVVGFVCLSQLQLASRTFIRPKNK